MHKIYHSGPEPPKFSDMLRSFAFDCESHQYFIACLFLFLFVYLCGAADYETANCLSKELRELLILSVLLCWLVFFRYTFYLYT